MSDNSVVNQISSLLKRSQKILLLTPHSWNGDHVSALFAFHLFLSRLGKDVCAVSQEKIPSNFSFLGNSDFLTSDLLEKGDFVLSLSTKNTKVDRIKYTINDDSVDIFVSPLSGSFSAQDASFRQNIEHFDVIFTLGMNRLEDLGSFFENNAELFSSSLIVNISSSAENTYFGKINFVDPLKSSLSETILDIIETEKDYEALLDKTLSTMLLTGVIFSTGSFLESNTTAGAFNAAAKLQQKGVNHSDIIEHLFKMKSLSTLKIWGRVLGNLEVDPLHRIAWSSVTKSEFSFSESSIAFVEGISSHLLRHTNNVDFSVLFLEDESRTVIQLRVTTPAISLLELQKFLGGGGTIVPFGIDFDIPKKSLIEIEFEFLKLILFYQKNRLNIPKDVDIQKMEILPSLEIPVSENIPVISDKSKNSVLVPEDPPFSLASKKVIEKAPPLEKTPKIEPVSHLPKEESVLPHWLKK